MSGISKKLMGTTAAGAEFLAIEDVFSTYLYTGNGSTQTITNGIDLAGEGGLVWIKGRSSSVYGHVLTDTERGVTKQLRTHTTGAESTVSNGLTVFNSDGFSIGDGGNYNASTIPYASWTFRKAPRFFDVVTYTGDGVAGRRINHNLGVVPGCIILKRTNTTESWVIYHRAIDASAPEEYYLRFDTDARTGPTSVWNYEAHTDSNFVLDADSMVNGSGSTYVAYLFAHDPLGPSGDGSDGLIACGGYTEGASAQQIDLGWEPQWILVKRTNSTSDWLLFDTMRGFDYTDNYRLRPNLSSAESSYGASYFKPTPNGFEAPTGFFGSGAEVVYIAIRRGPMRQPTSGAEVFGPVLGDGSGTPSIKTSFPVDMGMVTNRASGGGTLVGSRMMGALQLNTSNTNAESSNSFFEFDFQNGWHTWTGINSGYINWNFRRAPGFFDVVAYTGNGVAGRTVPHNLGVAPEMMIVKARNDDSDWTVYHKDAAASGSTAESSGLELNKTDGVVNVGTAYWNSTAPISTNFYVGDNNQVNSSANDNIAYLFATLPGVSKVGSYTGNGSSQTIDCGFTSGARFVLIKRTDSTGDWYVWDTTRGIVTGNDPHLSLNTTAAEVTTNDSVDPDSSGFIVNQDAATNINVSSASYIFLAIA